MGNQNKILIPHERLITRYFLSLLLPYNICKIRYMRNSEFNFIRQNPVDCSFSGTFHAQHRQPENRLSYLKLRLN